MSDEDLDSLAFDLKRACDREVERCGPSVRISYARTSFDQGLFYLRAHRAQHDEAQKRGIANVSSGPGAFQLPSEETA